MRILHVISTLSPTAGGPSNAVLAMAQAVAALGHDVAIHATDFGTEGDFLRDIQAPQDNGVRIVLHRHLPPASLTRHASFGLWRTLANEIPHVDVVHLHSLYMFHDWVVGRECRRAAIPYILRPHGSLDPFIYHHHRLPKALAGWAFQDRVTKNATLIHFTTDMERDLAQPYVFGRPGVVIPLGVNREHFAPLPESAPFRARYPEIGDRRIVLFLSRLNFKKGLEILIPAFADAAARRDDLHLVLAGPDGGFETRARQMVIEMGLTQRSTFTGHLRADQVREALAAAAIFVLPSRTENFGLAAAEALAGGVPSILSEEVQIAPAAARAAACRTAPLSRAAWTQAMIDLLAAPQEARAMGERARRYALETFSWPQIGVELVEAYQQAIAMAGSQRPSPPLYSRPSSVP
jgi:glycosyltransferase involved in cell wall biosynthesis